MSEQPKRRRSFKNIKLLFGVMFALIVVFWVSFFVTLAIRSSHPVDYLFSYVEDFFGSSEKENRFTTPVTEKRPVVSSEKENHLKNSEPEKITSPATEREKKILDERPIERPSTKYQDYAIPVNNSDVGIVARVGRVFSIEDAVKDQVRRIPHYVTLEDIPNELKQAIIAVEDTRFYSHSGFDMVGIARAAVVNAEAGQIEEGASTITQQLAKNLFLSSEPSFTRKAEELILAMELEDHFSKDKIIELYLNTIYFGSNFYGIYDAAKGYFGKSPKDLTVGESTMLAGLPNAPSLYSPYVDFMLAKKRQLVVINAMTRAHFLSEREAENARIEEIVLAKNF